MQATKIFNLSQEVWRVRLRRSTDTKPTVRLLVLIAFTIATARSIAAQAPALPPGASLVVAGLEGLRGLSFGPDGLLYVAEAGLGGALSQRLQIARP